MERRQAYLRTEAIRRYGGARVGHRPGSSAAHARRHQIEPCSQTKAAASMAAFVCEQKIELAARVDTGADFRERIVHLGSQETEYDDNHNGYQHQNQGIFYQTLASLPQLI